MANKSYDGVLRSYLASLQKDDSLAFLLQSLYFLCNFSRCWIFLSFCFKIFVYLYLSLYFSVSLFLYLYLYLCVFVRYVFLCLCTLSLFIFSISVSLILSLSFFLFVSNLCLTFHLEKPQTIPLTILCHDMDNYALPYNSTGTPLAF